MTPEQPPSTLTCLLDELETPELIESRRAAHVAVMRILTGLDPNTMTTPDSEPIKMFICEVDHIFLKPDVTYLFEVDPLCEKCCRYVERSHQS